MTVKLFEYLRDNAILDQKALSELRDNAAIAKRTAFQELLVRGASSVYGMNFETLAKVSTDAASQQGQELFVLEGTAGFVCDREIYDVLGGLTETLSKQFIPLYSSEASKRVAMTICPDNDVFIDRIMRAYSGSAFTVGICSPEMWKSIYQMYVEPLLLGRMAFTFSSTVGSSTAVSDKSKESEARRLYTKLLNVGVTQRASDVHFLPCTDECKVLFRIDGNNHEYTVIPKDVSERIANILKADGAITTPNPHMPLDGKVRFSPSQGQVPNDEVDLRVSIIPTRAGSDLNVRYLSEKLYTFEELGMSIVNINKYKELLELPSGMVIQVGPTGSGKSTTLYAGLSYIHNTLRNILTIEDPVEILMDGISQIDVNADNKGGLTFSEALKACLRHDPDVVVVGELRDNATAFEAVRAANTGHLVLTSLHTNDSIGAFERMINLGIDPYSLGDVMAAVMGQRLVRRLCPYCKQEYTLNLKSDIAKFYKLPNEDRQVRLYKPVGCVHCNNTGYRGRVAINEVLLVDTGLRELIQKHAMRSYFEDYLRKSGFRSMYQDGIDKVMEGITSLEEMTMYAKDMIAFKC